MTHPGLCKYTCGGTLGYTTKDKDSMPGHLGTSLLVSLELGT